MSIVINLILAGVVLFIVIEMCKFKWLLMDIERKLREKPKVEMIFK